MSAAISELNSDYIATNLKRLKFVVFIKTNYQPICKELEKLRLFVQVFFLIKFYKRPCQEGRMYALWSAKTHVWGSPKENS